MNAKRLLRRAKKRQEKRLKKIRAGELKPWFELPRAYPQQGMPHQVHQVASAIRRKARVVNHGGKTSYVGGKPFPAKIVRLATGWLHFIRAERRRRAENLAKIAEDLECAPST